MKNALNNQVGMLGDMFLWLVANLKQGVIYFIKQALPPNISAGSVHILFILLLAIQQSSIHLRMGREKEQGREFKSYLLQSRNKKTKCLYSNLVKQYFHNRANLANCIQIPLCQCACMDVCLHARGLLSSTRWPIPACQLPYCSYYHVLVDKK